MTPPPHPHTHTDLWGGGWGTGALPAVRTLPRARLRALGWGRGSRAWQRAAGRKEKPRKFLLKRNRKEQRR